ncbi:Scr1 family TA system antitoxin-like transcriptional regulator [Kineosporia mesophila]|uniref:Scr1 family TA system antitoxin-like transcriptional regulator n=1 Tax=Kineosporia mesophila TaxID=566012 RepID=UPI0038B39015
MARPDQRGPAAPLARPDVDIRVLPSPSGAHGGGNGEFKILRFPEGSNEPPLFYGEGYLGGQYSAAPEVVADSEERYAAIESSSVPIKEHLR